MSATVSARAGRIPRTLTLLATWILHLSAAWPAAGAPERNGGGFADFLRRTLTIPIDTNYVGKYDTRWMLRPRASFSGSTFAIHGNDPAEGPYTTVMRAEYGNKYGIAASYRGVSASVALNPARLRGESSNLEMYLNLYGTTTGIEANFNHIKSFAGKTFHNNADNPAVRLNAIIYTNFTVNGYYVFNHRRFSQQAALNQSRIQQRSCGSAIAGASFFAGRLSVNRSALPAGVRAVESMTMRHIGIGAGYAYNYVPAENWLLSISVLPQVILWKDYRLLDDNEQQVFKHWSTFDIAVSAHASASYSFRRYFVGFSGTYNSMEVGSRKYLRLISDKWRVLVFVGIRL